MTKPRNRGWRIAKRILLGLLAFVLVAVGAVLILLQTDYGRGIVRDQVAARLDQMFVGGASIGKIEGSPFGTLVVRGVVLNCPDKKPAITIERLELELGIMPLLSQQAKLSGLAAEGVVVDLRRDENGELMVKNMTKPGPKSTWSVDIPEITLKRARIAYDTGSEVMHFDNLELTGSVKMPYDKPLDATIKMTATWTERDLPLALEAAIHKDLEQVVVPQLAARAGDVTVAGSNILVKLGGSAPAFAGSLVVTAPRAGVAKIAPEIDLPGDLALTLEASGQAPTTHAELVATLGEEQVNAVIDADLGARKASGVVTASELDLAALTRNKLIATGGGMVTFDLAQGADGELPVGNAMIHASGSYQDFPHTRVTAAITSDGKHVTAKLGATNPGLVASLDSELRKIDDVITLERSKLVATTRPAAASAGKAPIGGTLRIDLAAHGKLTPEPSLAVAGRIDGSRLAVQDLKVRKLALEIDARRLPERPTGKLALEAQDVERGSLFLRELNVKAADRGDGRIAVQVRTRPKQDPWLVEADALVTPGDTVTIDLHSHRVRAGTGTDWTGQGGRVAIGKTRIEVTDLKSASAEGALAIQGLFHRAGARKGDFVAKVDVGAFKLATLKDGYAGEVDAKIDLERRDGKLAGTASLDAQGIALDPKVIAFDVDAKITAGADQLAIVMHAGSPKLGRADLTVDIDAPKDIANTAQWKRLHRGVIRTGRLALHNIDVTKLAEVAGASGKYAGTIDGDLLLSSTDIGGVVRIRDVMSPQLRALGKVNADLTVSQPTLNEVSPRLVARVGDIGTVMAQAKLATPDHLFDPAAWRQLGRGALKYASVSAQDLAVDPALIDRLGITTYARGKLSFTAEVSEAIADAKLKVALRTLRGSPIAQPVDVDLLALIDGRGTKTTIDIKTRAHERKGKEEVPVGPVVELFDVTANIPLTIRELEADPKAALAKPLRVTAKMPNAPAQHVLAVFARREVTGGTLDGTIEVAGTVGKPTVVAKFVGTGLMVPPGPGGKPIKEVKKITLDATWDGTIGKVALHGVQADGMLSVDAAIDPKSLADASVTIKAKRFDLLPVLAFAPGPAGGAAGRLDANLSIRGLDLQTAKLAGRLHLEDGRIPIAPQVGTLRRSKIDVVVGDTAIDVNVDGWLGPGTVKGTAKIGITGAMPTGGEGSFKLRKVQPIGVVEPSINADVSMKLKKGDDRWIADIDVRNGVVKVPEGRGEQLKPVGAPVDMVFMTGERMTRGSMAKEPPSRPAIVANITIGSTFIESAEVRSIVKGKLQVTTDGYAVGITGRIDADRGTLDLFGHRYQVERASIRFDGTPDPLLDIRITHEFPEVTTVTEVRGRLSKPDLVMTSNPGTYSQGQLLGFLLGGEPDGQPGDARDRATAAGTSFVANKIGGYVKDALPIDLDVLRYEAATASSSAAVTVGTWLSRDLFLAYRRRLEARPDENANEGDIEYWLSRRVLVEGVIGDRNINGVDLLWRKRY